MRKLLVIVLGLGSVFLFYQCNPERQYVTDDDAVLEFSLDTVYFDTIFTTIGTATYSFKLYNPHSRFLMIDEIQLAGGEPSVFRINVDGTSGIEFENYEIAPKDSMYVFVEATLDPNGSPDILRIQDSITFVVNGNLQDVDLVAWGQDVHILKDSILDYSTTWTAEKPYLIVNAILVDSAQTLSIDPGVKIYMHRDASIYVLGSLEMNGTLNDPIVVQGDRLEAFYENKPGQWYGIFFLSNVDDNNEVTYGSTNNIINHAYIKNGTIGLFVNSPIYTETPVLKISNTEVNHMSYAGMRAMASSVEGNNLVIGDCGSSCLELLYEGNYSFTHSTFANYWPSFYSNRTTTALTVVNYLALEGDEIYPGDITEASFKNCIIYGDKMNELLISNAVDQIDKVKIGEASDYKLNYSFDHCLMKINKSDLLENSFLDYTTDPNFIGIIPNENPLFDSLRVSYELDSLSPAIDMGKLEYGISFPEDKNGILRTEDGKPDLGAFEW